MGTVARSDNSSVKKDGDTLVIEIKDLTVRYGGVIPIDNLTIDLPMGTCGVIGPNGAGKTTFFNVLSGFTTPAAGSVRAFGQDLLSIPHFERARWGVRRTFQTEQAIPNLTVFDNVRLVHENTGGPRSSRREDVMKAVSFVGLQNHASDLVGVLTAGERRLVELARAVVGSPRLILLDEPSAGLPDDETMKYSELIQRIATEVGALVVLVEHDMSLVSACCEFLAVFDFGKLIASGKTEFVLRQDVVVRAYLGSEESK